MLLDDVFAQDRQVVAWRGLVSAAFRLRAGTGQGKRHSMDVFNGAMAWLRDEVLAIDPLARAWVAPFARAVLDAASPATTILGPPSSVPPRSSHQAHIRAISQCAHEETRPWPRTQQLAADILSGITSDESRCALMDALGEFPLPPLQYVDDTVVACPSLGAACQTIGVACASYARKVRAQFNDGPGKTALMLFLHDGRPH